MSKGNYTFSQVPRADIPRSTFMRNHSYKSTFDAGLLIPFYVDEALPGDTFNVNVRAFARLNTLIVPIMDNLYLDMFFFAVPNRLVWDNWQKFCGEQKNPGDSTDYVVPSKTLPTTDYAVGSIYDYMGLPQGNDLVVPVPTYSVLPFRAYNLIYNEWFRDQNLIDSVEVRTSDDTTAENYTLLRRAKRHDYFTSCLPWPQKGPGVDIPIGGQAVVKTSATDLITGAVSNPARWALPAGGFPAANVAVHFGTGVNSGMMMTGAAGSPTASTQVHPTNLYADLAAASAGTINDLRQAFQIQRLLERDARGGTRYVEILKAHFGVTSPDARLQRPEYLGGSSTPVNVNGVAQTSGTPATPTAPDGDKTPQGNLSAYGVVSGKGGFTKSFVEHSIIIGIVSVRADLAYQQGLHRMWSRRTRYDFYWPALSHLGEQAVLNKELGVDTVFGEPDDVFGYQERWAEYKYHQSMVTGQFRSSAAGSLDYWHLAQNLSGAALNQTFIEENPPIDRIVAVPTEPAFLFDSHFSVKCARPMPLYSVPGMADHF